MNEELTQIPQCMRYNVTTGLIDPSTPVDTTVVPEEDVVHHNAVIGHWLLPFQLDETVGAVFDVGDSWWARYCKMQGAALSYTSI